MNLKIACQGQEFNFEEVYSFEELKLRLHQTEPSFILESLTYQDEEDDIITLANENDFSCLSTNSNFTVQAQGKFDEEWAIKEFKRNQRLIKRIAKKVKQLKQKQKNNLIQRREYYSEKLRNILQQQKQTQEIDKDIKTIRQQIELQQKINIMNSKLQVKSDEGKFKQTICEFITKEEAQLTYEEENMQKFKRKIELFEQNLCQYFFKCYQTMRLDQFVEIKEKQVTGKEKLLELSKQLHQLKQTKKKQLFQLNLKECYFTQKLRAAKCLLEKL